MNAIFLRSFLVRLVEEAMKIVPLPLHKGISVFLLLFFSHAFLFFFFFASARVPTIVVFNLLWPNTYFTFGAVIGKLKEHFSGDVVNTGTNVKLGANANVFPIR